MKVSGFFFQSAIFYKLRQTAFKRAQITNCRQYVFCSLFGGFCQTINKQLSELNLYPSNHKRYGCLVCPSVKHKVLSSNKAFISKTRITICVIMGLGNVESVIWYYVLL